MFKSIVLEVVGDQRLACEGCEERIEHVLKSLPGVRQVRASARKQRIEVLFDTAALETVAITDRLRTAGYEIRVEK